MDQYLSKPDVEDDRLIISDIVKEYPKMLQIVIYHNNYHLPKNGGTISPRKRTKEERKQDSIDRSVRRTRMHISDLIRSNKFDLWCTFTFDQLKVDRYNVAACKGKMSRWLHRQSLHSPNMQYLIVPEFHKDGALHFHALISGFNGRLKNSKVRSRSNPNQWVYNMTGYRSGHTDIIKIGEYINPPLGVDMNNEIEKIGHYIAKYITKDTITIFAKKRYWCSQGLNRPTSHVNGLSKFNLWNLVKNTKPSFMNNEYEMFQIPIVAPVCNDDNNAKLLI